MAEKSQYTSTLLSAILYALYFSFTGKSSENTFPVKFGMIGLLSKAGLIVTGATDGFDVQDTDGNMVASVRQIETRDGSHLTVEPASLVFKALELLGQPIPKIKQRGKVYL
jgi:hypothetical protein